MREDEPLGGLDVAVDAITVGVRHRKELGNLDALRASIEQLGLVQPITITPGRVLVCGWRRLEAVKQLGWTKVRVWVRSGLSGGATRLLAEHDENVLRQAYTRTEQAALYREFKEALRQEAQRRQEASRFAADGGSTAPDGKARSDKAGDSNIVGAVESTAPAIPGEVGGPADLRDQAALLATGKKSWQAMERIGKLMDLSVDPSQPEEVQALAAESVDRIEDGGQVAPDWERVQALIRDLGGVGADDAAPDETEHGAPRGAASHREGTRISLYKLRVWGTAWEGIARLLDEHDPAVLGPELLAKDWETLCTVQRRLTELVEQMRVAREAAVTVDEPAPKDEADVVLTVGGLAEVIPLGARP